MFVSMKSKRAGKLLLTFVRLLYLMYKDCDSWAKYLRNYRKRQLLNTTKNGKNFRSNKEKILTNFGECAKIDTVVSLKRRTNFPMRNSL